MDRWERVQHRAANVFKDLRRKTDKEMLEELGGLSVEYRRLWGHLITVIKTLKCDERENHRILEMWG